MFRKFAAMTSIATHSRSTTTAAAAGFIRFSDLVHVAPYGVLGSQLTFENEVKQIASLPEEHTVIVDPAGLHHIQGTTAGAGGAAGAIYKYLGIDNAPFPKEVVAHVTKATDAKFHEYDGKKKVIHVVGPDFRHGEWSEEEAAKALLDSYRNVFREFALSQGNQLRLLPVSGGIFSGNFQSKLPQMTAVAMEKGYESLATEHLEIVGQTGKGRKKIIVCIFNQVELPVYMGAFGSGLSFMSKL